MSRASILQNVRDGIKNAHIKAKKVESKDLIKLSQKDLISEYVLNQTNNKSEIVQVSKKDVLKAVNDILATLEGTTLVGDISSIDRDKIQGDVIKYDESVEVLRAKIFEAKNAVIEAKGAIANLGIIALASSKANSRLSSLCVENAIFLLDEKDVVCSFKDGISKLKTSQGHKGVAGDIPTNMIFVAGPSRTADIELQTVFGVHGPRRTFVVLYK